MSMRVLAIGVLGKSGNPLFVQSYASRQGGEADLKWHYATHTALDFFDERDLPAAKTTETYLGLLYAMEDYAVYGYQSNTRIKLVLIIALHDAVVRDTDVKAVFNSIHEAYIAYISNPFTKLDVSNPDALAAPIQSSMFRKRMDRIAGVLPPSATRTVTSPVVN